MFRNLNIVLISAIFSISSINLSGQNSKDFRLKLEPERIIVPQSMKGAINLHLIPSVLDEDGNLIHDVYRDGISVIGVGDIMMGTNYPNISYLPPNDGKDLLKPVKHILKNATVTFGNLEGVLLNDGGTAKKCNNPNLCFAFRMPESYAKHLVNAGFDMVSIANNHTGDFGSEGRERTVAILEESGIAFAGLLEYPQTVVIRQGIRFGMAAFSPNTGTVSIHDLNNAKRIVKELKQYSDIVIVSFHGGAEGATNQNVKCKTEMYYGENRGNVCAFAKAVIDAGADIVFGHGPHVTRSVDIYKDRFIIYSLGNFCTYGRFNLRGENGIAPIVKVYVERTGKFIKAEVTPIIQINRGEPIVDERNRAIKSLQRLLKEDFPNSSLIISDDGVITVKN